MNRISAPLRALALSLAALLGACAAQPRQAEQGSQAAEGSAEPAAPVLTYAEIALRSALARARANDLKGADDAIRAALEHASFGDLKPELQHWGVMFAGLIANDVREYSRGLELLRRSSAMPEAGADDWYGRFLCGFGLQDHAETTTSLTVLARRWPETLANLKDNAILNVLRDSSKPPVTVDQRLELFQAMFDMKWRTTLGEEPDWVWRDLALMLLSRNRVDQAVAVARKVDRPSTLISMTIDRRFDSLRGTLPLDPRAAMKPAVERARAVVAEHPRSLEALMDLTYTLLAAREFREVLRITEPFTLDVSPMSAFALGFEDWQDYILWMVDNRARAFDALGKWDQAEALFRRAANKAEGGDVNVSQAINLGSLLCRLGRPADALQAVAILGEVSPFGRMQLETVRLSAALQRKDTAMRDESLNYMRAHERDAIDSFQENLIRAGLLDEAAALLLRRLADETLRSSALAQMQRYYTAAQTPRMRQYEANRSKLLARHDVIDAIAKVGRLENFEYYYSMEY